MWCTPVLWIMHAKKSIFFCIISYIYCALPVECRGFEPPFYIQPPCKTKPLLFIFLRNPPHFRYFFGDNTPMKYRINTKTNSQRKVISSRLQKMLFCRQNFYKQHQAMGWFEIIKISGIKRSQKKKKYNWKTCRVQEYYCYKIHILLMKSNASSIL